MLAEVETEVKNFIRYLRTTSPLRSGTQARVSFETTTVRGTNAGISHGRMDRCSGFAPTHQVDTAPPKAAHDAAQHAIAFRAKRSWQGAVTISSADADGTSEYGNKGRGRVERWRGVRGSDGARQQRG